MSLNEHQIMIRDMARSFAAERLAPFAAEWDREARFPAEAVKAMGELGLHGHAGAAGMGRRGGRLSHLCAGGGGDRGGRRLLQHHHGRA